MIIPFEKLDPEVLDSLIEEFVTREGTDSGYIAGSVNQSISEVRRQLANKDAYIVYDEKNKTWNIVSKSYLKTNMPGKTR